MDKRENQADEQIHMQSTLERMMNVCTGMHMATFSHPHLQLMVRGQAGRGAQHRGRGRPGGETVAHHDVQGCPHACGDTLPRHMRRGQKEGEAGTHEEEAYAVKSQEDRRKQKTEMESHLEVTGPEHQGMRKS